MARYLNELDSASLPLNVNDILLIQQSGTDKNLAFNNLKQSIVVAGSDTFHNDADTAVTITHNAGLATYYVMITPTSATGGYLGEYYVTNKTNNTFDVIKTGSGDSITFDWILIK